MANRLVGNVYIIDSVGLLSTQPETKRFKQSIHSIGFYSVNSSAAVNIALASNTTNIVFPLAGGSTNTPNFEVFNIENILFDELQVITATAGTAYLYLG